MDIKRSLVFAFLMSLSFSTLAQKSLPVPASDSSIKVIYDQGTAISVSDTATHRVGVYFEVKSKKQLWLGVLLRNKSGYPIDIGPENIQVFSKNGPVEVLGPEEVLKREKRKALGREFLTALAMAGNAYNAGLNGGTQYHSGTISGRVDGVGYNGTYYGSTYDPNAAAHARAAANSLNHQIAQDHFSNENQIKSSLQDRLLYKTTVMPGDMEGGQVMIALPKVKKGDPSFILVRITLKEGVSEFLFNVSE